MKNKINYLILTCFAAIMVLAGCEEEELSHTEVTPVTALFAPEDNAFLNLEADASVVFEWEAAKAADNGVVLYEVVFDTEEGDFSEPVYSIPSDGNGLQRTLTIPFADLNRIAQMAGIEPEATGTLKWTVLSSKGINVQESMASRIIEVKRAAGFPAPDEVYITGSATEGGEVLEDALLMKQIESGVFEIFTRLEAGDYNFASGNEGSPETYYIENNKLKNGEGAITVAGDGGVYKIVIDFNTANTEMFEVTAVELFFSPNDEFWFNLPYVGNGTWAIEDAEVVFREESWGRDERYKFRMTLQDGAGTSVEQWYGSTNADNQRPTADTPPTYWYMVPVTNDRWQNAFKFPAEADNNMVDLQVIFNTEVPAYLHSVTPL